MASIHCCNTAEFLKPFINQLMEDLFPFVARPFKSINLPCLQCRVPFCLYCDLEEGVGALQHGLRQAERSVQLVLCQTLSWITCSFGVKSCINGTSSPSCKFNRVRVMSLHIQPCIETAKAQVMEQKQRKLPIGNLDPPLEDHNPEC